MKTLNYKTILSVAVLLVVIGVFSIIWQKPWDLGASVRVGDQYQSTTTPQVADRTNLCPARLGAASSTTGVLGAVNVLGYNTGDILLLDATTTNVSLRTNNAATSTIILAWFPGGTATSSVHFDIEFKNGLLVDYGTNPATTTISYRCEG